MEILLLNTFLIRYNFGKASKSNFIKYFIIIYNFFYN